MRLIYLQYFIDFDKLLHCLIKFNAIAPDLIGFGQSDAPSRDSFRYTFGTAPGSVVPDGYCLDLYYANTIDDYAEKQSDLIFDFQEYLREHQPKLLAIWGQNDPSCTFEGACSFKRDVPNAKVIGVKSGHLALESCCREIADNILEFFG